MVDILVISTLLIPRIRKVHEMDRDEELYVATRAINGEGRLSQYDASDARAFVLSK